MARTVGYPAVLKILSEDISHKSDVGGVALHLEDEATLLGAARTMLARLAHEQPNARIQGFTVQSMVQRRHAQELIVGSTVDPVFGPVILFGQGGTAAEVLADRAVALPPLNLPLAQALLASTQVSRLLAGETHRRLTRKRSIVFWLRFLSYWLRSRRFPSWTSIP